MSRNNQKDNTISTLRNKLSPMFTLTDIAMRISPELKINQGSENGMIHIFVTTSKRAEETKDEIRSLLSQMDDDYYQFSESLKEAIENIPADKQDVISKLTLILECYSQIKFS